MFPPVWVGGVATQQLSGAAYGVSNWVEQHSWRTPVQDLASGNQSQNPQPSSAHPPHLHVRPRRGGRGLVDVFSSVQNQDGTSLADSVLRLFFSF